MAELRSQLTELRQEREEAQRKADESDRKREAEDRETKKQLDESFKKTDAVIAHLGRRMGVFVEEFIASRLWEKFKDFDYKFERAYQYFPLYDDKGNTLTDIDILLSNGEYAMAVEIKAHLELEDVNRHIKRMELIKKYPPAEAKGKRLLGAVGGANLDRDAVDRAHEIGFYVIEQSGDTVRLADRPAGFKAREW